MRFFTTFFVIIFLSLLSFRSKAQSVGGTTSGANTYCAFTNAGFISLSGFTGTAYFWESSTDGITWTATGTSWSGTSGPPPAPPQIGQSYNNLSQTTCYRAIVQNGAFPPDTSTISCITVYAPSDGGTINGSITSCGPSGSGSLNITGNTGSPLSWESSTDGGATWTNIANTTTTLSYTNITQTTIYQAIVQNGPSCPTDTSTQASITIVPPSSAGTISGNDTVCSGVNGDTILLSGITGSVMGWGSSTDNGLTWTPISNPSVNLIYSNITQTTLYVAIVQNSGCPADTSAITYIAIYPSTVVSAGNDTAVFAGAVFNLNGSGFGFPSWSPSSGLNNSNIFNPIATVTNTTTYTLTVSDTFGCIQSDNVIITVIPPNFDGMISNLFTPNGDGINDTWYIQNIENFTGNSVMIYNIYGNKVYEKNDYMNDWKGTYNGTDLPDGTYYYILTFKDDQKPVKGSVDIIRNK
jgi:gliding motility-associated-like protein